MKNILEYKGYQGTVEISEKDSCLFGKILGIKSLITYEGQSVNELIENFHNLLDEYLEICRIDGVEPERPFKGNFNVRINPELHKKLVMIANRNGMSLNQFVEQALKKASMS